MKLINNKLPVDLTWRENEFITLVIEDSKMLTDLAYDFIKNNDENNWILSDKGKLMDTSKHIDIIFNPFTISLNQRKIINKLYDMCDFNTKNSEMLFSWNTLQGNLLEFVGSLTDSLDYVLQYKNNIELKDILKIVDLKFTESNTVIEKLIDYFVLVNEILKIKIFVCFNLKTYLNLQEIKYIFEQAQYHKFNILLIERFDAFEKISGEKVVIVDKDKCVIIKA